MADDDITDPEGRPPVDDRNQQAAGGQSMHFDDIVPPGPAQPPATGGTAPATGGQSPQGGQPKGPHLRPASPPPRGEGRQGSGSGRRPATTDPATDRNAAWEQRRAARPQPNPAAGDPQPRILQGDQDPGNTATVRIPGSGRGFGDTVRGPVRGRGTTVGFGAHPDGWDPAKGARPDGQAAAASAGTSPARPAPAAAPTPVDPHRLGGRNPYMTGDPYMGDDDPDNWNMNPDKVREVSEHGGPLDQPPHRGEDRGYPRERRRIPMLMWVFVVFLLSVIFALWLNSRLNGNSVDDLSDEELKDFMERAEQLEGEGIQEPDNNGSTTLPRAQATTATTRAAGAPTEAPRLPGETTLVTQPTTTTVASQTTLPPTIVDASIQPKFRGELRCNDAADPPYATLYLSRQPGTTKVEVVKATPLDGSTHDPDVHGNVSFEETIEWRYLLPDGRYAGGVVKFNVSTTGCG